MEERPDQGSSERQAAAGGDALLDYAVTRSYWSRAKPSVMGPYMMDGFGFPARAGSYRLDAERKIVDRLLRSVNVNCSGTVLDLGAGVGCWTEYFAQRFGKVIAVEASVPLYEAMQVRCSRYANATLLNDDVLAFLPEDSYSVIFLGGMLMYLNERDVVALLDRVTSSLEPGGIVLCRESTVRNGTLRRQGDYQVVYRSVQVYSSLFSESGLSVGHVELNTPYLVMQLGCEFIKKWKARVPEPIQAVPLVGALTYGAVRVGGARLTRLAAAMGIAFPELTNHFFVLRRDSDTTRCATLSS